MFFTVSQGVTPVLLLRAKEKSAWMAWKCYLDVTYAFMYIAENPFTKLDIDSEVFKLLEQFTIVLWQFFNTNKAWKWIFQTRVRGVINLPPTQDNLHQHIKRSIYQIISGWQVNFKIKMYLVLKIGAGRKMIVLFGSQYGSYWQQQQKNVEMF